MKERGILFSAPMVRALLAGTKSQTRRIIKDQVIGDRYAETLDDGQILLEWRGTPCCGTGVWDVPEHSAKIISPYGKAGDRLWVRETWAQPTLHDPGPTFYRADYPACVPPQYENLLAIDEITWKPSIHMFRKDCRILLEIVAVRVERLNDCSKADAKAEGVIQLDAEDYQRPEERTKEGWALCPTCAGTGLHSTLGAGGGVNFDVDCPDCDTHVKLYRHLWESINGAGSWAANPWVWVVEFKRVVS